MPEQHIILHVGASKCGSSALQTALSHTLPLQLETGTALYAALQPGEKLLHGDTLRNVARVNHFNYVCSSNAADLVDADLEWRHITYHTVKHLLRQHNKIIVSNEGWLHRISAFDSSGFFEGFEVPIDVIAYVRPQVPFMNSGWWQWGAWSGLSLEDWVAHRTPLTRWDEYAEKWANASWVRHLEVRLLPNDIATDFFSLAGIRNIVSSNSEPLAVNKGLPGELLRLFQRQRQLRPTAHSPIIDFTLSRYLSGGSGTPWVIGTPLVEQIIESCRLSNERLAAMMPPEQADLMRNDPLWWSADAYAEKRTEPWQVMPASPEEVDALCAEMINIIVKLDRTSRARKLS